MKYPDFEEFIAELNEHDVKYLIGGAHAVAFYARPRATKDLDIFIAPTKTNAIHVVDSVYSFSGLTVLEEDLLNPKMIVQLGVAPVRIDLLSGFKTIDRFNDAWKRRSEGKFGRTKAYYMSIDDLIDEKTAWNRPQDRVDVKILKKYR